jgi:[ribosomal protein S5]-alanine N-acetyltransferase
MLETPRLRLVPLTHAQLLLYKNAPVQLARELQVTYLERLNDPSVANDLAEALEFWLQKTYENQARYTWFTNWEIILKDEAVAIGGIGFAGFPDEGGKAMVGYGLDLRFHNRGYATEALGAMLEWAWTEPMLQTITAETPAGHVASQRVLIKNAFLIADAGTDLIRWVRSRDERTAPGLTKA